MPVKITSQFMIIIIQNSFHKKNKEFLKINYSCHKSLKITKKFSGLQVEKIGINLKIEWWRNNMLILKNMLSRGKVVIK